MNSNTGNQQTYEAGDQRTWKEENRGDVEDSIRFNEGQPNAHSNVDFKDNRSLSNRLAATEKEEREEEARDVRAADPLAPARAHGNEPSRGAKIDAELQRADEETLRNKGKI
ncbi:unnamed protein product [Somion occarium]|uniref:Uncharacterized protein n=1 Tax=Somion occarium TaxID=3059160 RepID=A0ABP1CI20_9APHY